MIGIIALLLSILLPSLNRARESAKQIKCLSNLRQIAIATIGYTNANKGFFPGEGSKGEGKIKDNWVLWDPTVKDADGVQRIEESRIAIHLGAKGDGLREFMRCPSDEVETHQLPTDPGPYPFSYSMNQMLTDTTQSYMKTAPYGHPSGTRRMNISRVRNPSQVIMVADETEQTIDDGVWKPPLLVLPVTDFKNPTYQGTTNPNQLSDRHEGRKTKLNALGRGNCAFVDGHAEFVDRAQAASQPYHDPLYRP